MTCHALVIGIILHRLFLFQIDNNEWIDRMNRNDGIVTIPGYSLFISP